MSDPIKLTFFDLLQVQLATITEIKQVRFDPREVTDIDTMVKPALFVVDQLIPRKPTNRCDFCNFKLYFVAYVSIENAVYETERVYSAITEGLWKDQSWFRHLGIMVDETETEKFYFEDLAAVVIEYTCQGRHVRNDPYTLNPS